MIEFSVLLIEDDPADFRLTARYLEQSRKLALIHAEDIRSALKRMGAEIDIILLDLNLPDSRGSDSFEKIKARARVPIIILSGLDDQETAVQAVSRGAQDYLLKSELNGQVLKRAMRYAIERYKLVLELKKAKENEHNLAITDPLTGLPNRKEFYNQIKKLILSSNRYRKKFALLFIDIDNFKAINDNLGHSIGDAVLKIVATKMLLSVRECDVVARISGDEFTIILPEIQERDLNCVIQRITGSLRQSIRMAKQELVISLSIGVSFFPGDGGDFETLIKNADIAMYSAKKNGKNKCCYFNQAIHASLSRRWKLEGELQQALKNKEFRLYFQPIVNLKTNILSSFEVLLRWQHPEMGLVSPGEFILLAEEIGLIIPLEEWILQTACDQYSRWQEKGLPSINMSINLSIKQFHGDRLIAQLRRILDQHGFEPGRLGFEITEHHTIKDVNRAMEAMREMKEMGVQLIMDDFGSGYSSFYWLSQFPIDMIKIDQSFIRDFSRHEKNVTIIKTIITLAQGLKLRTIGEGVETREQRSFLKQIGCDEMQGYLYSEPLCSKEFEEKYITYQGENV